MNEEEITMDNVEEILKSLFAFIYQERGEAYTKEVLFSLLECMEEDGETH